jgi:hypothetical protein
MTQEKLQLKRRDVEPLKDYRAKNGNCKAKSYLRRELCTHFIKGDPIQNKWVKTYACGHYSYGVCRRSL